VVVLLFAVQDAKKWMMTTKVNPTFRDCWTIRTLTERPLYH
jgi:hypothetical protein